MNLISKNDSLLVVVDIQKKLAPQIFEGDMATVQNRKLLNVARALGVPFLITEQYPKGLGETVDELAEFVIPENRIEKMTFSSWREETFQQALNRHVKKQIILTGMETHVCVLQTALDLIANDFDVYLVSDAVGSRTNENKIAGIERMRHQGVCVVTTEMVLFEWLERAGTEDFKQVLPFIK